MSERPVVFLLLWIAITLIGWWWGWTWRDRAQDLESELRRTSARLKEIQKLLPGGKEAADENG